MMTLTGPETKDQQLHMEQDPCLTIPWALQLVMYCFLNLCMIRSAKTEEAIRPIVQGAGLSCNTSLKFSFLPPTEMDLSWVGLNSTFLCFAGSQLNLPSCGITTNFDFDSTYLTLTPTIMDKSSGDKRTSHILRECLDLLAGKDYTIPLSLHSMLFLGFCNLPDIYLTT